MPLPRTEPRPVDETRFARLLEAIRTLEAAHPTQPIILYTSFSFSHNYLKLLKVFKRSGALVVLMLADHRMCGSLPLAALEGKGYFDLLHISTAYLRELPRLVATRPFAAVHASVGTGSPHVFAEMVRASLSPTIIDFFDFREIMFEDEAGFAEFFGVRDLALEFALWHEIFLSCSGIIYMDSPELFALLERRHGHRPLSLHFQSYVDDDWLVRNAAARTAPVAVPPRRIAFIGGLHGKKSHGQSANSTMLGAARAILDAGFAFEIVNGMDCTGEGYGDYLQLQRERQDFRYHFAMDNEALSAFLTGFDLGWFYEDRAKASETPLYSRTLMGSRLFNYLEAGLPVAVSDTMEFVAAYVREHSIGLVLSRDDLPRLGEVVRAADWEGILHGVVRAGKELSMGAQSPRLLAFYNQACGAEIFAGSGA